MKQIHGANGILLGGAAVLMAVQPALAAPVKITNVQLDRAGSGVNLQLQTSGGETPQVFAVNRKESWTADITNSQLSLPGGPFQQENPAPGIRRITVAPLDGNSVRVTVEGNGSAPVGQINRSEQGNIVLSVSPGSAAQAAARTAQDSQQVAQAEPPADEAPAAPPENRPAQPIPQAPPMPGDASSPASPFPVNQRPLVPNPQIEVDGQPATQGVPPYLPRAVAPPVGDIAASQVNASPQAIDLGSNERVRLVLKDAPAREVLSLLARTAGLNIAFTTDTPDGGNQPQGGNQAAAGPEGPRISLDVENESVQDVFNYVLRLSGLEANRIGRTIFVAPRLPNSAKDLVVRTLRLNQIDAPSAANFLVTMGAEAAIVQERTVASVIAVPVTQLEGAQQGGQEQPTVPNVTQNQVTQVQVLRAEYEDSNPILRGLQVSADQRTNAITLTGPRQLVDVAAAQLMRLDVRRRQVAINVRVIDINLLELNRLGSSFSFGVNDSYFINEGGLGIINFGRREAPATTFPQAPGAGLAFPAAGFGQPATSLSGAIPNPFNVARNFLLQLQAVVNNGNAKILTDPTLVVQEGQTANVRLIQEVITNVEQQTTSTETTATTTVTVEKGAAGLVLNVNVDRIDDNGFVSLSVAPTITAIDSNAAIPFGDSAVNIVLLNERQVQSGLVRLRDGQTLILAGIIQDADRVSVDKIPILGDLPLIGALFRKTERENQRREVIVLLTPRILDDTHSSRFGYTYTPGPDAQRLLNRQNGFPVQAPNR